MIDTAESYPPPKVIYRRSSAYCEMIPSFHSGCEQDLSHAAVVNLCDYWDYLAGITHEAVEARRASRPAPLRRLSVFITDRCNLRCGYCRLNPATAQTIDIGWLLRSLPTARRMGVVFLDLMGLGEPTLIDELPMLLREASSLGLVGTVGTNGATTNLANPTYLSKLFEASPLKLRVSLDSSDPDEHNQLRGNQPTWQEVIRFIEAAVKARERGHLQAGLFVNRVVTATTLLTIPRDLKFFAELGVDDVHLIPVQYETKQFSSPEQIRRFNAEIAPRIQEIGAQYLLAWARENAYIFGRTSEEIERASRGLYYRPTVAKECYVLKAQVVLAPRLQPFTCLWSKRAGGEPIEEALDQTETLEQLRERLIGVRYLDVNPAICEYHCTKEVISANDRVEKLLQPQTIFGSG